MVVTSELQGSATRIARREYRLFEESLKLEEEEVDFGLDFFFHSVARFSTSTSLSKGGGEKSVQETRFPSLSSANARKNRKRESQQKRDENSKTRYHRTINTQGRKQTKTLLSTPTALSLSPSLAVSLSLFPPSLSSLTSSLLLPPVMRLLLLKRVLPPG